MSNNYCLIFMVSLLSIVPMICIKKFAQQENKRWYLYLALIFSAIVTLLYVDLSRKYAASQIYSITKFMSIIIITIVGYLFLEEKLTIKHIIGILFGIVSIMLLVNH